jgi:peptidoglycan/xylan/chitin deacetylase (PgdA/CDA1 family)
MHAPCRSRLCPSAIAWSSRTVALVLAAAAIAGCGAGNAPLVVHPGPAGCTHHLVFARDASSSLDPAASRHEIALSFDDTPSPYTESIVRVLLRYHAPATFFVIGDHAAASAMLLRAISGDGFELGNHSYTHPRGMELLGGQASRELTLANAAIEQATGFQPCLFRPPYGVLTPDLVQRAKILGLTTTKWSVDPADWTHPGATTISDRVLAAATPGAIVVLHDNAETRGQTLQALPRMIAGLRARGLHLVTISALLGDSFIWH